MIKYSELKFKTLLDPALVSIAIMDVRPVCELYDAMILPVRAFTNQKIKNSAGTAIEPIVLAPAKENALPEKAVAAAASPLTCVLPSSLATAPTPASSEVPTVTFRASRYCPFGTRRSSRSLFIMPDTSDLVICII